MRAVSGVLALVMAAGAAAQAVNCTVPAKPISSSTKFTLLNGTGTTLGALAGKATLFDNQEPGSNDEIMNTLKYVRPGSGFTPAFPLTQKLDVNGLSAHSFWSTARAVCPSPSGVYLLQFYPWTPVTTTDVAWNFEKVLLDVNLRPIRRYASTAAFSTIEADLKWLLG
ncbi:hypothetical protein FNF28_01777 [Cafeteria roenbergensis]|uniref:Glutathione peroxidase n=1 Tax=Cafeteria roenbergensis TaxID=33653 RepID=A0A5A8DZF1_CAFRO|nr:hypothetical protein FNF28_01777 [Cafeteria roenbergensis]